GGRATLRSHCNHQSWPPDRLRYDRRAVAPARRQGAHHHRRPGSGRNPRWPRRIRFGAEGPAPLERALSAEPRPGRRNPGRGPGGGSGDRRPLNFGSRSRRYLSSAHPRRQAGGAGALMFAKIPCILRPLAILVLPMLLFACAPKLQPLGPVVTAPSFGNDRLVMDDGVGLPLRHWPAEGKTKAVVLAIHGFNDYSHAFEEPAEDWAKEGIATYAFDQRGFGHTEYRGLWAGDHRMVADVKAAVQILRQREPKVPFYLLGESMGGAVVMSAMVDS